MALLSLLTDNPKYTLMRGVARFAAVRDGVVALKSAVTSGATRQHEQGLLSRMDGTLFPDIDREAFLAEMKRRGCAFGLKLPQRIVESVTRYAETHPVYAFRNEHEGFLPQDRHAAETVLGKEILLAQYYNCERDCEAIDEIAADPLLNWVAQRYLGSVPLFLGCNLWWTYPVHPNRAEQLKHAHFFHRDIDDFRFMKYFFYLTDVEPGDGGHWFVSGSHRKSPHIQLRDRFVTRRFEDSEIGAFYDRSDIIEVVGPKGNGFSEDTLCVHKAASPTRNPRLMLQLQFALFDLGVGNDGRDPSQLKMLPIRDAGAAGG